METMNRDETVAYLLAKDRGTYDFEDLVTVVTVLRSEGGCPWDRAQTHHTLRQYMIEEACEAADAMDGDDDMKIADELGDVLLQVVLNSCIGAEHRAFTDRDVTSMAARKMRRASHLAAVTKRPLKLSMHQLNHASGPCLNGRASWRRSEQRAGASVSAQTVEKHTAAESVTENCW